MKNLEINLLSGYVELTEGKHKRVVPFDWALAVGDTEEQIRENFKYSSTFTGRRCVDDRKRVLELEAKGCVRLVSFTVKKQLGESCICAPN